MTDRSRARLRIRYEKLGKIRFTSSRDTVRMWERTLRRSGLPVAWSEGFTPRPQLSFGLALPTTAESRAEFVDVVLTTKGPDLENLGADLTGLLPTGMGVHATGWVGEDTGSLQEEVGWCTWELEVLGLTADELGDRVKRLLAADEVVIRRERKGRVAEDDIRQTISDLTPLGEPGYVRAVVATQPRGLRPAELLEALGEGATLGRACRTHQWIERDGERWEPLGRTGELPGVPAGVTGTETQ